MCRSITSNRKLQNLHHGAKQTALQAAIESAVQHSMLSDSVVAGTATATM